MYNVEIQRQAHVWELKMNALGSSPAEQSSGRRESITKYRMSSDKCWEWSGNRYELPLFINSLHSTAHMAGEDVLIARNLDSTPKSICECAKKKETSLGKAFITWQVQGYLKYKTRLSVDELCSREWRHQCPRIPFDVNAMPREQGAWKDQSTYWTGHSFQISDGVFLGVRTGRVFIDCHTQRWQIDFSLGANGD